MMKLKDRKNWHAPETNVSCKEWINGGVLSIIVVCISAACVAYGYVFHTHGIDVSMHAFHAAVMDFLLFRSGAVENITEFELAHMRDVRRILAVALTVGVAGMLTFRIYGAHTRAVAERSSIISLALCVVLTALPFESIFNGLHVLLFEDGTWRFSSDSLLIRAYPIDFWRQAGLQVIFYLILVYCTIWFFGKKYQYS